MFFCFTNSRNSGSFRSLMNKIASPVLFISGHNSLFTLGNLSKLKTGCLIAQPAGRSEITKSLTLLTPSITFMA